MTERDLDAELLEQMLLARPDRLGGMVFDGLPAEMQATWRASQNALAAMALAEQPLAPPAALRARVLESAARKMRAPSTALLVIDMINDHLTPGRTLEVPRARAIVPALRDRLQDARARSIPVVYVVDRHDPEDPDLDAWGVHALAGSEGGEVWPELAPEPGDRVVYKPTYSAFVGSDLGDVLDEIGAEHLIVTGCLTEIGILATATDALERGLSVEVPADAQAGTSKLTEGVTLRVLSLMAPYGAARKARKERLAQRTR
jgi:nicotinamidase/pyrazinamidase